MTDSDMALPSGRSGSINRRHHKSALTIFMIIVLAHWSEHIVQAVQIWVLGWKATLLDYNGETEKADQLLDTGRENFGEDPDFLFLEAAILVRRQFGPEAMDVIERLLGRA